LKVAIVGTSHALAREEEKGISKEIRSILERYRSKPITIISGGAKGVDTLAIEVSRSMGLLTDILGPIMGQGWAGFKERNIRIANECDALYCITVPRRNKDEQKCYHHTPPQDHRKTAGCFTMNKALELNKPCELVVIEDNK